MLQGLLAILFATSGLGVGPTSGDAELYAPPPPPPENRLVSEQLGLDTGVGVYADCSGASELTHESAAIDSCLGGRDYFIGHNPGVFTPLIKTRVGDTITYYDAAGGAHPYRVVGIRTWNRFWGSPPFVEPDVVAQFQTCITLDATWDEILDAVAA